MTPVGQWTRPHCGVTHLITYAGPWRCDRFQYTVEDYQTFAAANVIGRGFKTVREVTFRGEGRVEAAKRWLEAQADLLDPDWRKEAQAA